MDYKVKRIFVEKKPGFDIEAQGLFLDLTTNLGISGLEKVKIVNRYDIEGLTQEQYLAARGIIFSEPNVDDAYDETYPEHNEKGHRAFGIEYLPGQYDQRADSTEQCVQILTLSERPTVKSARIIVLEGNISDEAFLNIKNYCINPVESREAKTVKPETLDTVLVSPTDVEEIQDFIEMNNDKITGFHAQSSFAMSVEDLLFCQKYFRDTEKRNPFITELKVLDTYWSDHCRHTTFLTQINNVEIENTPYNEPVLKAYEMYKKSREKVYVNKLKDICLMDLATIATKELKKDGKIPDLDESDEINACSVKVNVDVNGKDEEWLVMFKNETHNHPTEIEPFGGAATCLGGAIRDPLSGRSYVYQAMRVTGSGDPRKKIEETIPGKLPQRKISTGAAAGYSSYGNQIGLATGQVTEIYHEGYVAKRMEIGAVIGAAPACNVRREKPEGGDVIILLGGRTGRDGCGGATGSSKEHTEDSLTSCGAEVQKGNPPTERKIQRLFRDTSLSRLIKRCNDFGAGGVCVAVGELADGLEIDLDKVPKKYEGLDGTELAISESQERMAVVVESKDADLFIAKAAKENLEAVKVAIVTKEARLKMQWRGKTIVNISREFLDTNGVSQNADVTVGAPSEVGYFDSFDSLKGKEITKEIFEEILTDLNVCSQKGLVERFDSSIGAGTVNMPFGGKHQLSPEDAMTAKIPLLEGETNTGTIMTFGYNPLISSWSPFHGAVYAVLESVAKVVAAGGNYKTVRLSLQEYFEKLGREPLKWGKPFSALLGAFMAQEEFEIPAIGGKDSMSGTFKDMSVPPTLVSFAMTTVDVRNSISGTFRKEGSKVYYLEGKYDKLNLPDFEYFKNMYTKLHQIVLEGKVLSARTVKSGGLVEAISKSAFGNAIGLAFDVDSVGNIGSDGNTGDKMDAFALLRPYYGSIIIEVDDSTEVSKILEGVCVKYLGKTRGNTISLPNVKLDVKELSDRWLKPLGKVFSYTAKEPQIQDNGYLFNSNSKLSPKIKVAKPRVFIPVFPGTNCEYDTAKSFVNAGGEADIFIINNLSAHSTEESIKEMANRIRNSQIIAIPGGFSGGDEPEGSGKFIATAFRNKYVTEAVMDMLKNRDGLMIGICNGFQALIKLGLVPYGEISEISETSPTLTFNNIGRHVSNMVNTKIVSNLSPWLYNNKLGDTHTIAVSHGEGRFVATDEVLASLSKNGQIATQYVDLDGKLSGSVFHNPNGSVQAIEGITSPCGRVFGKMGHSERMGRDICKNVPGNKDQKIFEAGIKYFG